LPVPLLVVLVVLISPFFEVVLDLQPAMRLFLCSLIVFLAPFIHEAVVG